MAETSAIFLDSAGIYAVIDEEDRFHQEALDTYDSLVGVGRELLITSYTFIETIALLERRLGFDAVADLMRRVQSHRIAVVWIDDAAHWEVWRQYAGNRATRLNFVDWTTVVLAQGMGAPIFTFDGGFAEAGFAVLPEEN